MNIQNTEIENPEGIKAIDLTRPAWTKKQTKDRIDYTLGDQGQLTFYYTQMLGWVIATLPIGSQHNRVNPRTYAVSLKHGGPCRCGNGPHILKKLTVFIRTSRVKAIQKYLDLYKSGLVSSNNIRDRISSRRAEGAERRADGQHSWMWRL